MEWNLIQFLQSGAIMNLDADYILVGYGQAKSININQINHELPAFYFSDFFLEIEHPWLQFEAFQIFSIKNLIKKLELLTQDILKPIEWDQPDPTIFYRSFSELQNDFNTSKLEKVVPYAFTYSQSKMCLHRLLNSLKTALECVLKYKGYIYGFWDKDEGLLGVTPEKLFQYDVKSNTLSTVALAGTSSKGANLIDFQANKKEQVEHSYVISGIKQALGSFGQVIIEQTSILELPSLNHLITPIHVKMYSNKISFEKLVKALHPTPALGAYPQKEGWKWLQEYQQKIPRGYYGAPVGLIYPKRNVNQCFVAIRNVQWNSNGMRLGAGCGVIKNSQCEQEWKEINLKMKSIKECLAL